MRTNFERLYTDMLVAKFPEKLKTATIQNFLKAEKNALNIIYINDFIAPETAPENSKYIAYDQASLKEILTYQEDNKLKYAQTAKEFNISRMTLRKWKKHFQNCLILERVGVEKNLEVRAEPNGTKTKNPTPNPSRKGEVETLKQEWIKKNNNNYTRLQTIV